jgi:hypothetical protein
MGRAQTPNPYYPARQPSETMLVEFCLFISVFTLYDLFLAPLVS